MANTYHSISPTTNTVAAISSALVSKYGSGITIHFQDSTNLIFYCSALSNKVQKITYSSSRLFFYYGDSWTSGTTITNQVAWAGYANGACSLIDMILGDNTVMIASIQGTTILGTLFILGKMTNDKYAVLSMCGGSNVAYSSAYLARNTSDNVDLYPVCFSRSFASGSGKLFKQPLILQRSDGAVELNADNTIASFIGVYNCSHTMPNNADLVGGNYILSPANLYGGTGSDRLYTSMMAEF